jgi:hypothetical protein
MKSTAAAQFIHFGRCRRAAGGGTFGHMTDEQGAGATPGQHADTGIGREGP